MYGGFLEKEEFSEVTYPRVKRREIAKPFKPLEHIAKVFIERDPARVNGFYFNLVKMYFLMSIMMNIFQISTPGA